MAKTLSPAQRANQITFDRAIERARQMLRGTAEIAEFHDLRVRRGAFA